MIYYVQTKPMGVPDIPAHGGARRMYKTSKEQQLTFDGFNRSCGMKLNPKDEYVLLADMIDWAAVEAEYSALFKSRRGRPAASARMALGSLIIQKRANLSDRRLVKEIARGKVKDPVEFGAKYDVSVGERGHARLEHVDSMDAPDGVSTCHMLESEDEAA